MMGQEKGKQGLVNRVCLYSIVIAIFLLLFQPVIANPVKSKKKPLKVFILSGQSNMVGFGNVSEGLTNIVKNKKMFPYLLDKKGNWVTRTDVRYLFNIKNHNQAVPLSINANGDNRFGPELGIGHHMGNIHGEDVLIIKACNGNRCLGYDVLPPSMRTKDKFSNPNWRLGCEYDNWFRIYCKKVLNNLEQYYPGYEGQGYQIAGFGWWQGHKDIGNREWNRDYEKNLVALINDLRKEFNAPKAPFVVATIGFGGHKMQGDALNLLKAQMAVGDAKKYPEFKGNVASVDIRDFYRGGGAHYGSNAETYMSVGDSMGRAMAKLIKGLPDGGASAVQGLEEKKNDEIKHVKVNHKKPLKVYIMSGQSNMVGFGTLYGNGEKNLDYIVNNSGKYKHLSDGKGGWAKRKDVFYVNAISGKPAQSDYLSATSNGKFFGPELQFGNLIGDYHDEMALIIKVSIGNRSLGFDVMPPSSRVGVSKEGTFYKGWQYDIYVADALKILKNLKQYYPDYQDQGYEIAGFCWWQGHKDAGISQRFYEKHLVNLINDLRIDLKAPNMKATIATVAFGGIHMQGDYLKIFKAQMAMNDYKKYPNFKGNVGAVDCRPFSDGGGAHYGNNAHTYYKVGNALGETMIKLLENTPIEYKEVISSFQRFKAKKPKGPPVNEKKKVKVYILMGQSNMVGMGWSRGKAGADLPGTLENVIKRQKKFTHLMDKNGDWTVRNDVFYVDLTNSRVAEWLTVGNRRGMGPELQFGNVMGDHHDEMVVVIKAAQGNRSIGFDINPPSSRPKQKKQGWYYGWQYDVFVANVHKTLNNLKEYYPDYKGQGYEIAGFCWWQGHKDAGVPTEIYEKHLVNLIKDLRKEFNVPNAKFSVATVGFGGQNMSGKHFVTHQAQMNVSDYNKYPEFKGNVGSVDTRPFWRSAGESPREEGYHYHLNCETISLVGDALAKNIIKLNQEKK